MAPRSQTLALALAGMAVAAVVLFLWIPFDVQSGIVEVSRRRKTVGDALAPAVAGVFILVGALLLVIQRRRDLTDGMSKENLGFIVVLTLTFAASLVLMRWTGPLVATLMGEDYRLLRADVPWKYIGFSLGGWVLVFGLVTLMERKVTLRAALFALAMVVAMIAAYDWPFDDLLLPPNGDV